MRSKIIIVQLATFILVSSSALATPKASLGELKIEQHLTRTHKSSVVLSNEKGTRLRIDCLDGRQGGNTIVDLISEATAPHEIFTGTNDFYCSGLEKILLKGLKEGDSVDVSIDFSREQESIGSDTYEVAQIKDIIFAVAGESKIRSLRSNPGTKVAFKSMEAI